MDKAGKAAHGRCTAAKPEEKDLVSGFEVFKDEPVALQDIGIEPRPKSHSGQPLPRRADTFIVKNDLVVRAVLQHPEKLIDVAVMAFSAVLSGPIGKYYDILCHPLLLYNPADANGNSVPVINLFDIMTDKI